VVSCDETWLKRVNFNRPHTISQDQEKREIEVIGTFKADI